MEQPITLEQVYLLLGEKDVLIFRLGNQFNQTATEKARLEEEVVALKGKIEELHGKLARANEHLAVFQRPGLDQGDGGGRSDFVRRATDQSSAELNPLEQDDKDLRGVGRD